MKSILEEAVNRAQGIKEKHLNEYKLLFNTSYLAQAREELLARREGNVKGFRDVHGYIVDYHNGETATLGEGTLHTAIAIIGLASSNYHPDDWDQSNANAQISSLLETLMIKSWGNQDNLSIKHPIRHIGVKEYNRDGVFLRRSPLTKDAFGPIIAALYYAYHCSNSSIEVKSQAKNLLVKWVNYLLRSKWKTHYNYIEGEFESETIDGKNYYKNIFSENGGRVMFKGPEAFLLMPHEIYALKNVAASMGLVTDSWDVWTTAMPEALMQLVIDMALPELVGVVGEGLDHILKKMNFSLPYSFQLGPDNWSLGLVEGQLEIGISDSLRNEIVNTFKSTIKALIIEALRAGTYRTRGAGNVREHATNAIIELLPDEITSSKWFELINFALHQITPWTTGEAWVEAVTFIATAQLLKRTPSYVVSYSLWPFSVECEVKPDMADLLMFSHDDFFRYIKNDGNPNGFWAWLSSDLEQVNTQIDVFESKPQRYWWKFAYGSTKYNDWVVEPETQSPDGREAPRLDYITLYGLRKKGPPSGILDLPIEWWQKFLKEVQRAVDLLIQSAIEIFNRTGRYARQFVNELGEVFRETWENTLEYTQETFKNSELILLQTWDSVSSLIKRFELKENGNFLQRYWKVEEANFLLLLWKSNTSGAELLEKMVHHLNNTWEEIYYKGRDGFKFWRGLWESIDDGAPILERFVENADDTWEEIYTRGREGFKYWRGLWESANNEAPFLERFVLNANDTWEQIYLKGRDGYKYWRGLWKSIDDGAPILERFVENADDTWEEIYTRGREGFKFWRGLWESRRGGAPFLERFVENADDTWEQIYLKGREGFKYWRGLWESIDDGAPFLERFVENADDTWEQIYLKGRDGTKFWRGLWESTDNGAPFLEFFKTNSDDTWEEIYYRGRDGAKFWRGLWESRRGGAKQLERFSQLANDHWQEVYFFGRGNEKYWSGLWGDPQRAESMINRLRELNDSRWSQELWNSGEYKYERSIWNKVGRGALIMSLIRKRRDDYVLYYIWNEAREQGYALFNAVGELIERSGLSIPGLPNWWPPEINIPWPW